jgi:hypothetical protein
MLGERIVQPAHSNRALKLYPPFYPPMEIFERDLSASEMMRFARFA